MTTHKNDVKNAKMILEKFGKKKPSKDDRVKMLRKETNWPEQKVQSVMKSIMEEEQIT